MIVTGPLHTPSARGFPLDSLLGLGSAWVSSQVIFSGYTADSPNSYPRSMLDLEVFIYREFNSSLKSQTAKRNVCLQSFWLI